MIDRLIAINEGNFILKKGDDINKVWQIGRLNILFYHISNKKIMQKILLKDAKAGQKVTEYKNAMAVYLVTGNEPNKCRLTAKLLFENQEGDEHPYIYKADETYFLVP